MEIKATMLHSICGIGYVKHSIDIAIKNKDYSDLVEYIEKFTNLFCKALCNQYHSVLGDKNYVYTLKDIEPILKPFVYNKFVQRKQIVDSNVQALLSSANMHTLLKAKCEQDLDEALITLISLTITAINLPDNCVKSSQLKTLNIF